MNDQPCLFPTDNYCAVPDIFSRMRVVQEAKITIHLSPREIQVMRGIADGLTYAQIAHALRITERTVKTYVSSVAKKTGKPSTASSLLVVVNLGLIFKIDDTEYYFNGNSVV